MILPFKSKIITGEAQKSTKKPMSNLEHKRA
jgi:hypothetical protein